MGTPDKEARVLDLAGYLVLADHAGTDGQDLERSRAHQGGPSPRMTLLESLAEKMACVQRKEYSIIEINTARVHWQCFEKTLRIKNGILPLLLSNHGNNVSMKRSCRKNATLSLES